MTIPTQPFHTSEIRVRYAETDQMGIAHHSSYFLWFEVARTEMLRSLGFSYQQMESSGVFLPVIETHCRFFKPCLYDEVIWIETHVGDLSKVRSTFHYKLFGPKKDLRTEGYTMHASVSSEQKICPTPAEILTALKKYALPNAIHKL